MDGQVRGKIPRKFVLNRAMDSRYGKACAHFSFVVNDRLTEMNGRKGGELDTRACALFVQLLQLVECNEY